MTRERSSKESFPGISSRRKSIDLGTPIVESLLLGHNYALSGYKVKWLTFPDRNVCVIRFSSRVRHWRYRHLNKTVRGLPEAQTFVPRGKYRRKQRITSATAMFASERKAKGTPVGC